jgi:hypothetical protein
MTRIRTEAGMSLIHPRSHPSSKTELSLDGVPPTQMAITKTFMTEYHPIATLAGDKPLIEFLIPPSMNQFIDLDDSYLYVRFKYTPYKATSASDKTPIKMGVGEAGPVNNLMHSLFSKVEVQLGGTTVTPSTEYYPYRAYFEKLLGYGSRAKNSYLAGAGWWTEEKDADIEKLVVGHAAARPLNSEIELCDKLHFDLANQSRLIIPGVPLKISLQANSPAFYIQSKTKDTIIKHEVEFLEVTLFIKHVIVSDYQYMMTEKEVQKNGALYPISRNVIKLMYIPSNSTTKPLENEFSGQLPRRITLGLVENSQLKGDFNSNPFVFSDHGLSKLSCRVNGEQIPYQSYKPNFSSSPKRALKEYLALYRAMNQMNSDPILDLTFEKFVKGYTLFSFNLAPDGSDGCEGHLNPIKSGNISFEFTFRAPTKTTLTAVAFCEYDNIISIDKDRNVNLDWHGA